MSEIEEIQKQLRLAESMLKLSHGTVRQRLEQIRKELISELEANRVPQN